MDMLGTPSSRPRSWRLAVLGATLLAGAAMARVKAPVRIDGELAVRRVADDAYVVTHEPFHGSNVLVVRVEEGTVVVCSSPFDTLGTRALVGWIRSELRAKRIVAINTHFHLDGSGGNEAYQEAGVETYASDRTQALIRQRGLASREAAASALKDPLLRARVQRTGVVAARHTFPAEKGLTFTFGQEPVRVNHPGPAHSPDNVVVHFPRRGLLFGGCMVKAGSAIGYTGDADLERWEAAVRALQPLTASVVVPGHGPVGGPELLENTIAVVRAARAKSTTVGSGRSGEKAPGQQDDSPQQPEHALHRDAQQAKGQ